MMYIFMIIFEILFLFKNLVYKEKKYVQCELLKYNILKDILLIYLNV